MNVRSAAVPDPVESEAPAARKAYTPVAAGFHWLLAALLIGQIAFGWFLTTIPRGTPMRSFWVNTHKSTGLVIAAIILLRILWRLTHTPPPLPAFMPVWERVAARCSHAMLYALMVIMPVSGYVASNFSKYGIKFFNAVKLPPWGVDDRHIYAIFNSIHVVAGYAFAALIAVHVLAAIRHAARRDGVFSRIFAREISLM